ncbi:MAG: FhaA domain-containing protein [Acidimicrobiales bacterium]
MALKQFEQRLERLVEGVFAKMFRSGLEPVELGRRLARHMDMERVVGVNGRIAPNHFRVSLSPDDCRRFDTVSEALTRELAEAVREHARDESYSFMGPVTVELAEDADLGKGEFLVASEMMEAPGGATVGSLALEDGRRVVIGEEPVSMGRLPECDIVLSDPNVSRRHAEVRRRGNDFLVVDLDSTNGTRVNGAGVRERRLADGDEITVGGTHVRFEAS